MRRLAMFANASTRSRVWLAAAASVLVVVVLVACGALLAPAAARQGDTGFSPGTGRAPVIAQGVVALPEGDAVWRTIRTRAILPDAAPFETRPLGFVLASSGPLLLVDAETGEQTRLGTGEAALVPAGTSQQRSSLGTTPVPYLAIELVPADAPPPPADGIVLQPGQPFPAPPGLHDLDLVSGTLIGGETFALPDSGSKNVILITGGAANVGRPGGQPVVLIAGEAASFSGELEVSVAPGDADSGDGANFVVAVIGPEVPQPSLPASGATATAAGTNEATETSPGEGSITLQVFSCPPGMDSATLAAAACSPASGEFDVTLSGTALPAPLTLLDAASDGVSFAWAELPLGDYVIAEAVLPAGATTYALAAENSAGTPETGFRVRLDAGNPDLAVRIYNFSVE
jgi:hypothetical protein